MKHATVRLLRNGRSILGKRLDCGRAASSTSKPADFAETSEDDAPQKTKQIYSRLHERHRILAEGGIPPVTYDFEKARSIQRQRFGEFGLASGVDIGALWPTVEEVTEVAALRLHRTFSDAARVAEDTKSAQAKKLQAKLAEIKRNEAKYEAKIAEFHASQVKAEAEKSEQDKVLERRIREIQEYFGYWIDPKDPRFEVMLQQKEAEERKAAKIAKRQAAEKKKVAAAV